MALIDMIENPGAKVPTHSSSWMGHNLAAGAHLNCILLHSLQLFYIFFPFLSSFSTVPLLFCFSLFFLYTRRSEKRNYFLFQVLRIRTVCDIVPYNV